MSATVLELVPNASYMYAVYQFASTASVNGLAVNGIQLSDTTSRASAIPTAMGLASASRAGTIEFVFTRRSSEVHLSGIGLARVAAVPRYNYSTAVREGALCPWGTQQVTSQVECQYAATTSLPAQGVAARWKGTGSWNNHVGACFETFSTNAGAVLGNGDVHFNTRPDGLVDSPARGFRVCKRSTVTLGTPILTAEGSSGAPQLDPASPASRT